MKEDFQIDERLSKQCADANNSGNYDPFHPSKGPIMPGEPAYNLDGERVE